MHRWDVDAISRASREGKKESKGRKEMEGKRWQGCDNRPCQCAFRLRVRYVLRVSQREEEILSRCEF
jgi:hypothetical protein